MFRQRLRQFEPRTLGASCPCDLQNTTNSRWPAKYITDEQNATNLQPKYDKLGVPVSAMGQIYFPGVPNRFDY